MIRLMLIVRRAPTNAIKSATYGNESAVAQHAAARPAMDGQDTTAAAATAAAAAVGRVGCSTSVASQRQLRTLAGMHSAVHAPHMPLGLTHVFEDQQNIYY
jgi:hypothetical protein